MNIRILSMAIICLCFQFSVLGQENPTEEVNTQIWQAFKTAYEARNSEAFKAIHTKDVLRINDGGIKTADLYFKSIDNWQTPNNDTGLSIDFAFENRQYFRNTGYETGYYRVIAFRNEKKRDTFYGQFHVVLKKVAGQWKIAQDFDTETVGGRKIDKTFFEGASLLELN
ncbi:MAG: nuclear transport factor 2 family protein [Bacteroidia bacterium]|nr:nuclear transport factor 2 family protein [Bacteroidia bacterium]NNK55318.1 nuclear transport factor 2 family protein [Flavobacteriaceae bacterium]